MEDRFVGIWKLITVEYKDESGQVIYPHGKNMVGRIWYDGGGRMAVQLLSLDRPRFASGDQFEGTAEEIRAAFEGFIGYYGTYTVDEREGTVTHHVEGSAFPNYIGGAQKRFYTFSGNRLTLNTPPIPAVGGSRTGSLIWERMP